MTFFCLPYALVQKSAWTFVTSSPAELLAKVSDELSDRFWRTLPCPLALLNLRDVFAVGDPLDHGQLWSPQSNSIREDSRFCPALAEEHLS